MSSKLTSRSSVSWGDLLQFQALPGAAQSTAAAARLLGLPEVTLPEHAADYDAASKPKQQKSKSKLDLVRSSSGFRLPLRMPMGFVAEQSVSKPKAAKALDLPTWDAAEAAVVEAMLEPSGVPSPVPTTLLDLSQSMALCRRALAEAYSSGLDVERTVASLAQGTWPSPLPQQVQRRRLNKVHICVDTHPDRLFLIDDYRALLGELRQGLPAVQWQIHELEDLESWRKLTTSPELTDPGAGTVMLLCEPALLPEGERLKWQRVVTSWHQANTKLFEPMVWLKGPSPSVITSERAALDADLRALLVCLSPAVTLEPALVRAMVAELRLASASLALESAVWVHSALDGALPFRQWYAPQQRQRLAQLGSLNEDIQQRAWRVIERQHAHCHQVQRDQELLNWVSACGQAPHAMPGFVQAVQDAKKRYFRVAQHLKYRGGAVPEAGGPRGEKAQVLSAAAHERLQSLPRCFDEHPEVEGMLTSVALQMPDANESARQQSRSSVPTQQEAALRIQGQRLTLVFGEPKVQAGVALAQVEITRSWVTVETSAGSTKRLTLPPPGTARTSVEVYHWLDAPDHEVTLSAAAGQLQVLAKERPHWAASFRQSTDGLQALIHWPDGLEQWLDLAARPDTYVKRVELWRMILDPWGPQLSWFNFYPGGQDTLAHLTFRYLPPATFLMGSPEGVGDDDERPQHPVTLTQGLWLAETSCTQSLWQAVMGHNPSHFSKGPDAPQRPVENVSWDDVQQFLTKLNALLPQGCEAVLPTEAQWEYACRAGTTTEYWWGDEPDDSKANFDFKGNKGWDDKEGTTPVDRYPPNPWGLRDMHGNVWEWCADGEPRNYEQRTARDPMGDTGGDARVVRGGSWVDPPGGARSACRLGWHRGVRARSLGFRFALRSSSPQGAEPQPGGLKVGEGAQKGGAAGGRSAGAGASAEANRAASKKKGQA